MAGSFARGWPATLTVSEHFGALVSVVVLVNRPSVLVNFFCFSGSASRHEWRGPIPLGGNSHVLWGLVGDHDFHLLLLFRGEVAGGSGSVPGNAGDSARQGPPADRLAYN